MQRSGRRQGADFSLFPAGLTVGVEFQPLFLRGSFSGWGGVYRHGLPLYGLVEIADRTRTVGRGSSCTDPPAEV